MSTADYQDRASSWRWQRDYAAGLVAGHGRIVVDFFDEGVSRRVAWYQRPQGARLLKAIVDPDRGFDAVVVGEYERAFAGRQLEQLAPMLRQHRVALWLPETYGPVDFGNPRHLAVIDVLGVRSQREVSRARYRTMAAMRAQVQIQGRFLGGRPPFGYRLVDAGPHPNRTHAGWGRRLHRLDPDPATAGHVRWIFEQRLAGRSVASIARDLNERGVPCPSSADPARNRHRSKTAWMVSTVAAILANPRYTGRQVWNRQHASPHQADAPGLLFEGSGSMPSWWVISNKVAHPPLISEEQFIQAQTVHTAPVPADGLPRVYVFAGLLHCGVCARLMDSHWVHQRASYRCRHGRTSAQPGPSGRPKILYVREDYLLAGIRSDHRLGRWVAELNESDPSAIGDRLRADHAIIICGHDGWVIEYESDHAELLPAATQRPTGSIA